MDRSRRPSPVPATIIAAALAPATFGCVDLLGDYEPSGCDRPDCVASWSFRFGDADDQQATAVAVTPDDGIVVVGRFRGTLDFGGAPLKSAGEHDGFVARFDRRGALLWNVALAGPGPDGATSVAVDHAGNILVTGFFSSTVTIGGQTLTAVAGADVFVVKLSDKGRVRWAKRFGNDYDQLGLGVAPGQDDDVLVTGCMSGSMDVGGVPQLLSVDGSDAFALRLDKDGNGQWGVALGGVGLDCGYRITADLTGNLLVAGVFTTSVTIDQTYYSKGTKDIFVAALTPQGTPLWARAYGGLNDDFPGALLSGASGATVLAGSYSGTVDFQGLSPLKSAVDLDPFIMTLGSGGATKWIRGLGGGEAERLVTGALDSAGDVLVAGYSGPPGSADVDAFVSKMSRSGDFGWIKTWEGSGPTETRGLAVDSTDDVVIVGRLSGSLHIAGRDLESAGGDDIFIAKLGVDSSAPE
ncbi:MAG: hypothetical protein U0441_15815 [Polyangiaceae bacterium]